MPLQVHYAYSAIPRAPSSHGYQTCVKCVTTSWCLGFSQECNATDQRFVFCQHRTVHVTAEDVLVLHSMDPPFKQSSDKRDKNTVLVVGYMFLGEDALRGDADTGGSSLAAFQLIPAMARPLHAFKWS